MDRKIATRLLAAALFVGSTAMQAQAASNNGVGAAQPHPGMGSSASSPHMTPNGKHWAGKGHPKNPRKYHRLMVLLQNPTMSIANANRYITAHGGTPIQMGNAGSQQAASGSTNAQQNQSAQASPSQNQTVQVPNQTQGGASSTPSDQRASNQSNQGTQTAQNPSQGGGAGATAPSSGTQAGSTQSGGNTTGVQGGTQSQTNSPTITTTQISTVVGGDQSSIGQVNQVLSNNNVQILNLQNALNNSNVMVSALNNSNVDVNAVVAVDVLPNGNLEVYTK